MEWTQLIETKARDFHGMQNLESINFYNNKLSSVPLDAFATLTKLRYIDLRSNQIEEFSNGIFKKNLVLEQIHLNNNRIKYLGTEIFDDLKKLNSVVLYYNICVNKRYDGATQINQLKDDIKMKCKNSNEVLATATTTTTTTQTPTTTLTTSTTQNPMEVNLIEMKEQISKLAKAIQEINDTKAKKTSNGEMLNCEFGDVEYNGGFDIVATLYSCKVTSLENPHNNLTIEGYYGEHKPNKNDADVKVIWIRGTNTKYIPTNLGSFSILTALRMEVTQLIEIKAKDFHGMQDLEFLSFHNNKLSFVPLGAFATLTKLRFIYLSANQIEELPNDIFKNNLELEEIYLSNNGIKYLGTGLMNGLKKLDYVDLFGNICINHFYVGAAQITLAKDDIKLNCTKPNAIEN